MSESAQKAGGPGIVQVGVQVLRARAPEVPPNEFGKAPLHALVERMVNAMRDAPGVGLAAPQLGVSKRVIVLEDRVDYMARLSSDARAKRGREAFDLLVVVNPTLEIVGDARVSFFEGCLSVAGYMAMVERAHDVVLRGLTPDGDPVEWRASGWPARIAQHEVDHLDGTLYVDRMRTRTLTANEHAAGVLTKSEAEVKKLFRDYDVF